jgi:leucyl/phenylalanyl-tRNA--protein transferase
MRFPNPLSLLDIVPDTGLKIIGNELDPHILEEAYDAGYFPWNTFPDEMLWHSPEPRFVLFPDELKISKSTRKLFRNPDLNFKMNQDFDLVLQHCANIHRPGQDGTWLYESLQACILELHKKDKALCVTAYIGEELIGGLYGIIAGKSRKVFCGESMFSLQSNGSKLAFAWYVQNYAQQHFELIDCQQETPYLASFGAKCMDAKDYLAYLK